ncbi:MAG TPA: hypothetical protein PLL72_03825 [Burkholderiaceae bacterium]|nr:hypothetical protein [Burkholderiaceae bacterium]
MPEINPTTAAIIATAVVVLLAVFGVARAYLAAKRAEPDVLRKLTEKTFHEYERAVVRLNQEANAAKVRAEHAAVSLRMLQMQMGANVMVPDAQAAQTSGGMRMMPDGSMRPPVPPMPEQPAA